MVLAVAGLVTLPGEGLVEGIAALVKVAAVVVVGPGGHLPIGHYRPFPSGLQSRDGSSTLLPRARDPFGLATR